MSEELVRGWVAGEVAGEFPELRLVSRSLRVSLPRRSPAGLRRRLGLLSDRYAGAQAVTLRTTAVPAAYRIFFHHIGLDPDRTRTPIEAAVLDRMLAGGFRSRDPLADALLIACLETGVPVWALRAQGLHGTLGIRTAEAGEALGRREDAAELVPGRLVVADARGPVAVLFGELARDLAARATAEEVVIFAVAVAGVPDIHVEEALWTCGELLEGS